MIKSNKNKKFNKLASLLKMTKDQNDSIEKITNNVDKKLENQNSRISNLMEQVEQIKLNQNNVLSMLEEILYSISENEIHDNVIPLVQTEKQSEEIAKNQRLNKINNQTLIEKLAIESFLVDNKDNNSVN